MSSQSLKILPAGDLHETAPQKRRIWALPWKWRFNLHRMFEIRERGQSLKGEVVSIAGDCLRPWLCDRDAVRFAEADARDGDIVVVDMIYRRANRQVLGAPPLFVSRLAVKQFRVINGEAWLASADGWVTMKPHTLRGVVVGWNRGGSKRPKMSRMTFGEVPFRAAS